MKTAIIFSDGIKQIMFTPENEQEKQALKLFTPNDDVQLALMEGSFHSKHEPKPLAVKVNTCQGGYLRAFTDEDSIMLVLTPKVK